MSQPQAQRGGQEDVHQQGGSHWPGGSRPQQAEQQRQAQEAGIRKRRGQRGEAGHPWPTAPRQPRLQQRHQGQGRDRIDRQRRRSQAPEGAACAQAEEQGGQRQVERVGIEPGQRGRGYQARRCRGRTECDQREEGERGGRQRRQRGHGRKYPQAARACGCGPAAHERPQRPGPGPGRVPTSPAGRRPSLSHCAAEKHTGRPAPACPGIAGHHAIDPQRL